MKNIILQLKRALASEYIAWYQYHIVINFMDGGLLDSTKDLFETNADEELNDHAEKLLKRIKELGGDIDDINSYEDWTKLSPVAILRPYAPYDTRQLIMDNMKAETSAINFYESILEIEDVDDKTKDMIEDILGDEEDHLMHLTTLYNKI